MHEMEECDRSVLPEGSVRDGLLKAGNRRRTGLPRDSSQQKAVWTSLDYVIEEAAGKVYPTTVPGKEADRETPSLVAPETNAGRWRRG